MANSQTFTLNIKALFDASDVKAKVGDIQRAFSNIKMPDKLQKDFNASFSGLEKALTDFETRTAKGVNSKADAKGMSQSIDAVVREFNKVIDVADKVKAELGDTVDLSKIIKLDKSDADALKALREEATRLKSEIAKFDASKLTTIQEAIKKIKGEKTSEKAGKILEAIDEGDIERALALTDELLKKQKALESSGANRSGSITTNIQALEDLRDELTKVSPDVEKLKQNYEEQAKIAQTAFAKETQSINGCSDALKNLSKSAEQAQAPTKDLANNQAQFVKEIDQVKSRIQYFFGLSNAINLVKRAIRGAVDTIKELDKAMTATAVVTDFSVGDMWEQLPEYTKRANELGVSTLAAYEAATLYYQQGLKTEEVNALSVETLKMARIAGLEAAEATDRMTNALRGFNMELTEANAQRVDDVYSELAANTASNVDEISTAMTKVASLAHNANMEFETTAAFLSQIIETTRESAETAGTALKTVVARFSEVKKLIDTNQLQGQDEEGQVIDVNRVGQALRTAGIDLNKYFLGEVGLDDIFIELASKWDTLTSVQQRYIATQAAGSRQQSRFIALMSDYARTQELVGKAYNSEGASAKQFAKTQESLESKLARLKNAWNEFLMGLTNNQMVKSVVDLLTNLLNTINKLTSAFGEGGNSIAKFAVALGGLAGGKALFSENGLIANGLGLLAKGTLLAPAMKEHKLGGQVLNPELKKSKEERGLGIISTIRNYKAKHQITEEDLYNTALAKQHKAAKTAKGPGAWAIWSEDNMQFRARQQAQQEYAKRSAAGELGPKTLFGSLGQDFGKSKLGSAIAKKFGFTGAAAGAQALGVALGGVAVAVGLVVAGYQAWLRLTPEGHLKQATAIADALNKTAANAQKAAKSMRNAYDQYNNFDEAVSKASTSAEKERKTEERTEYISQMVSENPALAQYVSSTQENGKFVLTLDEQGFKNAVESAEKGAITASMNADFANALKAGAQADVYEGRRLRKQIDLDKRQIGTYVDSAQGWQTREMTDREFAKYSSEAVAEANARREAQQYAKQGYLQMMQGMNLEDDIANVLAEGLAAGFDENKELTKINQQKSQNWWAGEATKEELRASYKKLYGSEADSSMGRKELAQAVAEAQVNEERKGQTQKVADMLTGDHGENYKKLIEAYSGQGADLEGLVDDKAVAKYVSDLFEGLDDSQLIDFANALGEDVKEVKDAKDAIIKKSQAQRKDLELSKKQAKANLFENILKQGVSGDTISKVVDQINGLTQEQTAALDSTLSNAAELLSPEKFSEILPQLTNLVTEQPGLFEDVQKLFGSINLDDPINAFNKLKAAEADASDGLKEYINLIRESNADIFSASNLVQSFIASADYDGLTKQMDKLIKKNEHLSAQNIEDMAEECDALNDLLETGAADAQTLAEAFTLIQQGKLAFDQITDSILTALKAGTSFEELITKVGDWISNFDKGTDLKEGTKHITESLKDLKEYVDNWEFGNEPTKNIYDHIFGEGKYDEVLKSYGKDFAGMEKFINAQIKKVTGYADNEGLGGIKEAAKQLDSIKEVEGTGGQFFEWDLSRYKDTNTAIAQIADTLGVTQDAALAFIQSWQTHMPELRIEWNELDYKTKLQAFVDNIGETKAITAEQLEALAALVGKSADEVAAELDKLFKETTGKEINIPVNVKWSEDGKEKTGPELDKEFEEKVGKYKDIGNRLQDQNRRGQIDYKQAQKELEGYGMSESQRKHAIDQMAKESGAKLTQTIEIPVKFDDGSIGTATKTITADSTSALEAGINAAMTEAEYDLVSKGLAGIDISSYKSNVQTATSTAVKTGADSGWTSFSGTEHRITVHVDYEPENPPAATGAIVHSYAKGSENFHVGPGVALTGEEGPEIVWNKEGGYSYITGQEGPEFQNLRPGDRVFNASETKRILQNSSKYKMDSFAEGGWKKGKGKGGSGGGSGSGSGSDKDDEWRNELDWLYNVMENITELERRQVELQEQYDDLLKDQTATGHDLYKNLIKQMGTLQATLDHQTYTLERREQEMREFMDTTNDEDEYLWYNWDDRTLEIDWDKINEITDQEKYDHITDLIDRAEEIQDKMDDAEDAIQDVKNQIEELENIWRDTFRDFEDRVLDAIVKMYQTVIDNYNELNDTLNESNQAILDSINKEISLQRQIRDNTKTEQEIADNEARLAYLQRDTTGGNDLAALQMGKELEDQRESYSDNLIDQAIQRLQDDNDAAAQQREKQIEIMQAQLDYQAENGEFNAYLRDLLDTAVDTDGHLATDSALYRLLAEQDNINAMTEVEREVWEEELNTTFNQVMAELLRRQGEVDGTYFTAVTAAFNGISETFDKAFHGSTSQGSSHNGSSSSSSGSDGSGGGGHSHNWQNKSDNRYTWQECSICHKIRNKKPKPIGGQSGGCFAPGTKIMMDNQLLKNIEDVKIGEYVLAYNEKTQQFESKKVIKFQEHKHTPALVQLTFNYDHTLLLTPGHPILTLSGWKSLDPTNSYYEHHTIATLLKIGDVVRDYNGLSVITNIQQMEIDNNYTSYNLEVEECHTYIANNIIVHNAQAKGTHGYATGGLNIETGFAMLHGTPSEPEYVLNARQTDAFLKLADILPAAMNTSGQNVSNTFGATTNNVVINVDKIDSDYSVDQMVDRVKEKLFETGSYRNNNVLSLLR